MIYKSSEKAEQDARTPHFHAGPGHEDHSVTFMVTLVPWELR
jgi:hypothetical protein